MLHTFADKITEAIWNRGYVKKYPEVLQQKARRKLLMIDAATALKDLEVPPSNKLRKMKGKHKNLYRINVDQQYRIKFKWKDGHAYNVEFCDDHDDL